LTLPYSDSEQDGKGIRRRHLALVMLAEAFYECRDFKKAESLFKEAIQVKKAMKKSDSSEDNLEVGRLALNSSDVEVSFVHVPFSFKPNCDLIFFQVKYRLHICHLMTNQVQAALHTLTRYL